MPTALVHRWLVATLAILVLQACASRSIDAPFEISEDYANNVIRYTVQRGDRLSDIALEFTGNLNSWLPIAEHNGITDPRALRVGSQIEIPTALIPGYDTERLNRRNQRDERTNVASTDAEASEGSAETDSTTTGQISDRQDARTQAATDILVSNESEAVDVAAAATQSGNSRIKVIGTYYPKGVYARPTLDAALMMRVAPGSDFELLGQFEGWYQVQTDDGQGYIRASDGRVVSNGL